MVSSVVFPFAFSSLPIRDAAADMPMTSAKMGSATLEITYVGAGIVLRAFMFLVLTVWRSAFGWALGLIVCEIGSIRR